MGHAGTLDPFATGLLLMLVGSATRLAQYLVGLSKRYSGVIRLGAFTDTDDPTGIPGAASDAWLAISDETIALTMTELTGARQQTPPAFSAKHVQGDRAHRRARRGETVELPSVPVEIPRFILVERHGADVRFETEVSTGTYVRSLARELGVRLGCGAHLAQLRRLAVGPFTAEEAVGLDVSPAALLDALRPSRDAVRHLPAITVDAHGSAFLRQGRPIPALGGPSSGPVALVAEENGVLLAVGEVAQGEARPRVVLGT